jgi:hypothetical protein
MAPTNTNTTPATKNKSPAPNSMTVTPAPILLGDKTIFLNVEPDMMKKIVESLDAHELFKVLPKKMSPSNVEHLQAAITPGNAKIDSTFILRKVISTDFDGNPYPPEAPEPDIDSLLLKSDPTGLVPPARVFLDKKEFIYSADKTTKKFEYIGPTDEPDSATGMLVGDGNVKTPHVDAQGTFVPIDMNYLGLKQAFDAAHAKKQVTPQKRNIAATLDTDAAPAVAEPTNDPPSDEETLDCIRCRAIPNSNASQLAKQNLREFDDNNNGSTDRTLKKNFKAHFISWAQSSRVSNKHFMARELLYQFMLKYNIVLSKGDVKELKREVRGFKQMDEVFDGGWMLPKSEVNV